MKRLGFILITILLFSCTPKKETKKETTVEITEVEIDEITHDFGVIKAGEIVAYSFAFTNIGEHNLIIKSAESDCGCITIQVAENVIKPGNKGIIEVEFNSSGLFGKELKTIDLDWNCKEPKQLVIFATVENEEIEIIY